MMVSHAAGKKGAKRVNYCFITFDNWRSAQRACNQSERNIYGKVTAPPILRLMTPSCSFLGGMAPCLRSRDPHEHGCSIEEVGGVLSALLGEALRD